MVHSLFFQAPALPIVGGERSFPVPATTAFHSLSLLGQL